MPQAGFKPAMPATKRQQTYALDRATTVNSLALTVHNFEVVSHKETHVTMDEAFKYLYRNVTEQSIKTG
jgi:hypothetical protein